MRCHRAFVDRAVPRVLAFLLLTVLAPAFTAHAQSTGYNVPVPAALIMKVRETAGIGRTGEVVRSGVPLPRSLNVLNTSSLAVLDSTGAAVPAEFRVLARWNAGRDAASAPIQWVMVVFPASVASNATASYRLVTNGSAANPAPNRPLTISQSGNAFTVDTGAAVFRLGADSGALFDEVVLDNGTSLIGGSDMTLRVNGNNAGHTTTRKVWVEHSGPLSAVVVVEGAYGLPLIGGAHGLFATTRRYVFTWGSPTAVVRHVVKWEGTLDAGCPGCIIKNGVVNGVLVEQVRDALDVNLGGASTVTAVGDYDLPAVEGAVSAGQASWVRQQLRATRKAPLVFDVRAGGAAASGRQADGGMLAAAGPRGAVALGLAQMHRYEPQALRLLEDGRMAVDLADNTQWLSHHQGMFATLAVSAFPTKPSRADLDRDLWAPLNRPLRAWPEPAWFASSDAVEEFPVGTLPADLAGYDSLLAEVMAKTYEQIDTAGVPGLMTYGVYPRYWGKWDADEMDCSATGDPTPDKTWDNSFWCGSWTDYHNTLINVPVWAMRSGQVEWLDEFAVPGALRTLHTQVMQCGPTEKWFYCGQAPAGYGAYRSDFNSSHAYFENLYQYYWLSGDSTVTRTLQRGGDSMRRFMCQGRGSGPVIEPTAPGGAACAPETPPTTALTGRVASQWIAAFRFLGLASPDATFLEDFQSSLARAYTTQYTEPVKNGVRYGFLVDHAVTLTGTNTARPLLQMGLYDTTNLFRLLRDTDDQPIGSPAIKPSQPIVALARTMKDITPFVMGDGTIQGKWPHGIFHTISGNRLGGTLLTTTPEDRELYGPEKTTAVALLVRAGQISGDASLIAKGRELTLFTIKAAAGEDVPLGKLQGQYLQRLHSAVARLAGTTSGPLITVPWAPTGLTASAVSATEIQLNWVDGSANEDLFRIERSVAGGAFQEVMTVGAGVTSARVTGLTASTAYSFRVRSSNFAGMSPYSNTAAATTSPLVSTPSTPTTPTTPVPGTVPARPSSLTARVVSATQIDLTWTDASNNETNFHIQRADNNGSYQDVLTVGANVTTARLTVPASTFFGFRVRASNAAGSSAYSPVATATTPAGGTSTPTTPTEPVPTSVPARPGSLIARVVSSTQIDVAWTDSSNNEAKFHIERADNYGSYREVLVVGANATSARLTVPAGTFFGFRVRASNSLGFSPYSPVATAKTP